MGLKELSKHYRETGEWTDEMEFRQNKYIVKNIQRIYNSFQKDDLDMYFEDFVGLHIGRWQAQHGFYRTAEQVLKEFEE